VIEVKHDSFPMYTGSTLRESADTLIAAQSIRSFCSDGSVVSGAGVERNDRVWLFGVAVWQLGSLAAHVCASFQEGQQSVAAAVTVAVAVQSECPSPLVPESRAYRASYAE
jgi:hypothetical protein